MTVPGGSPLNYPPGSQPPTNRISRDRAPTTNDSKNFREGDEWLDTAIKEWYKLADITGNVATWVLIGGGEGTVQTLTGDSGGAVPPDGTNTINVDGGTGISTTGNPGTNTITVDASGDLATTYTEDSGTATPAANNLNVLGTSGITTSGSGSTVTITNDGTLATTYTEDSGTATPAANNLNILGGTLLGSAGAGSTVTLNSDDNVVGTVGTDSGDVTPASNKFNITGASALSTTASGTDVELSISNLIENSSWTPQVEGGTVPGTITYNVQLGRYARIGPLVVFEFDVSWAAIGGASGDLFVKNFPLIFEGSLNRAPMSACWVETIPWPVGATQCLLEGESGTTTAVVWGAVPGGSPSRVQIAANGVLHATISQVVTIT